MWITGVWIVCEMWIKRSQYTALQLGVCVVALVITAVHGVICVVITSTTDLSQELPFMEILNHVQSSVCVDR